MKISWNPLCIFYLTILHYDQAQSIKNTSFDPLGIDQAYLTISNKNYSDSLLFEYNVIVCEHCGFDQLTDGLLKNSSQTFVIDTRYPYDFQLLSETTKHTLQCQIESYKFSEHGSYVFEIVQTNQNKISCTINQTKESSYYWLPIIIALVILFILIFFIQLWLRIHNCRYIDGCLRSIAINNESNLAQESNSITDGERTSNIANEIHSDDFLVTTNSNCELPLITSTDLSNNSRKALPKRLQSLDTFRGFSLMVMIFVDYGGKKMNFFLKSLYFYSSCRWWLLVFQSFW